MLNLTQRKYNRKSADQNERLDNYFAGLLERFHMHLFNVDYDNNPVAQKVDIFAMYNKAWKTYASEWNARKDRVVACNPLLFEEYAIKQDINPEDESIYNTIR
jgi:hypothetical protein